MPEEAREQCYCLNSKALFEADKQYETDNKNKNRWAKED